MLILAYFEIKKVNIISYAIKEIRIVEFPRRTLRCVSYVLIKKSALAAAD